MLRRKSLETRDNTLHIECQVTFAPPCVNDNKLIKLFGGRFFVISMHDLVEVMSKKFKKFFK